MNPLNVLTIAVIILLLLCGFAYFAFIGYHLIANWNGDVAKLVRAKGIQTLGLPLSAVGSFALVVAFPDVTRAPLEFQALGIEFRGPSSQIVLWCFTFLVLSVVIWMFRGRQAKSGAA